MSFYLSLFFALWTVATANEIPQDNGVSDFDPAFPTLLTESFHNPAQLCDYSREVAPKLRMALIAFTTHTCDVQSNVCMKTLWTLSDPANFLVRENFVTFHTRIYSYSVEDEVLLKEIYEGEEKIRDTWNKQDLDPEIFVLDIEECKILARFRAAKDPNQDDIKVDFEKRFFALKRKLKSHPEVSTRLWPNGVPSNEADLKRVREFRRDHKIMPTQALYRLMNIQTDRVSHQTVETDYRYSPSLSTLKRWFSKEKEAVEEWNYSLYVRCIDNSCRCEEQGDYVSLDRSSESKAVCELDSGAQEGPVHKPTAKLSIPSFSTKIQNPLGIGIEKAIFQMSCRFYDGFEKRSCGTQEIELEIDPSGILHMPAFVHDSRKRIVSYRIEISLIGESDAILHDGFSWEGSRLTMDPDRVQGQIDASVNRFLNSWRSVELKRIEIPDIPIVFRTPGGSPAKLLEWERLANGRLQGYLQVSDFDLSVDQHYVRSKVSKLRWNLGDETFYYSESVGALVLGDLALARLSKDDDYEVKIHLSLALRKADSGKFTMRRDFKQRTNRLTSGVQNLIEQATQVPIEMSLQ